MKRVVLALVMSLIMFTNSIVSNLRNPERMLTTTSAISSVAYATEPELQVFEDQSSAVIGQHYGTEAIHSGLAKAYIDTLGDTRAFVTLYDNNFKVTNSYILTDTFYPQLASFFDGNEILSEVINFSNVVWIGNYVIIYYHTDDTHNGTSRHKLLLIDVTNPDNPNYHFVNLAIVGNVLLTYTNDKVQSNFELEYVNNKLFLTAEDEVQFYSIAEITYNLQVPLVNGFNSGEIEGLVNSQSQIIATDGSSSLDYCQSFTSNVYCLDFAQPNKVYTFDASSLDLSVNAIHQNNYHVGIKTLNGVTTLKVYKYKIKSDFSEIEAELVSSTVIDDQWFYFPHIDYRNNTFVIYTNATKYIVNLSNYATSSNYYQHSKFYSVLYNEVGQKLKVNIEGQLIYATSDFYNLTFVILNYDYNVLAFEYYNDDLLILMQDSVNQVYKYYRYPITLNVSGGDPTLITQFNVNDVRTSLNTTYAGSYVYANNNNISLIGFEFYKDKIYLMENGRLFSDAILNFIEVRPNGVVSTFKYQLSATSLVDNNNFYFVETATNKQYIAVPGYDNGVRSMFRLGLPNLVDNTADVIALISSGVDNVASFKQNEEIHVFNWDYNNYYLEYVIDDGINQPAVYNIKLPDLVFESLTIKSYRVYYQDFTTEFAYNTLMFRLDSYNNLLITDVLGNTHVIYNPNLRGETIPGIIGINGDYSYSIISTSFDILVNNTINTISVVTDAFFKRVLVTNSSPFSLNEGLNVITTTLKALDNTIRTITFNIIRAPSVSSLPPIVLPGLDPNYVSSSSTPATSSSISSSAVSSSVISSSVYSSISSSIALSISDSSSISSSIISSSSTINSSVSSQIIETDSNSNNEENPYFIIFLIGLPGALTIGLYSYISYLKKKPNIKGNTESSIETTKVEESKDNKN